MSNTSKTFIVEVERRSESAGRTPTTIMVLAGFSPGTWYNWKHERTSPTAEAMDKVMKVIGLLEQGKSIPMDQLD